MTLNLYSLSLIFIFSLFYILLEAAKRKLTIPSEYTRKIAHVFSGLGALVASFIIQKNEYMCITFIFILVFAILYVLKIHSSIRSTTRKTIGEVVYPVSLLLLAYFLYDTKIVHTAGLLILAIPDVLAWIIGRYINAKKKSINGSYVYFLSSFIILLPVYGIGLSILFSLFFTMIEYLSPYGSDNLTVPVSFIIVTTFI